MLNGSFFRNVCTSEIVTFFQFPNIILYNIVQNFVYAMPFITIALKKGRQNTTNKKIKKDYVMFAKISVIKKHWQNMSYSRGSNVF